MRTEDILLRQRNTGQTASLTGRNAGICRPRLGQTPVRIDRDKGIDQWIEAGDPVQTELRQLNAGNFLARQCLREILDAASDHSITFGTRNSPASTSGDTA